MVDDGVSIDPDQEERNKYPFTNYYHWSPKLEEDSERYSLIEESLLGYLLNEQVIHAGNPFSQTDRS